MIEACCVVKRRRHKHDVILGKVKHLDKGAFRENERIVRNQYRFRTTSRARSGKNKHYFIRRAFGLFGQGLKRINDLLQGNSALGFKRFVVNTNSVIGKAVNFILNRKNLIFEVGLVMEGWADECLRFNKVHSVYQVFSVKGNGKRVTYCANFKAGHINDAEFRPGWKLEAYHIAVFDSDAFEPFGKAACLVVNLGIRKANTKIVAYIFALRKFGSALGPVVIQRFFGPVTLFVVLLFVLLVYF